jgi:hypothetical protein
MAYQDFSPIAENWHGVADAVMTKEPQQSTLFPEVKALADKIVADMAAIGSVFERFNAWRQDINDYRTGQEKNGLAFYEEELGELMEQGHLMRLVVNMAGQSPTIEMITTGGAKLLMASGRDKCALYLGEYILEQMDKLIERRLEKEEGC